MKNICLEFVRFSVAIAATTVVMFAVIGAMGFLTKIISESL